MPRLMSVSRTEQAVVDRRKTVTRRAGWLFLKAGDRLTLCRKVMGRKPDEPLVRLAEVEVVDVRREPLHAITVTDLAREGVDPVLYEDRRIHDGHPLTDAWVMWFCDEMGMQPTDEITRIEWRYL